MQSVLVDHSGERIVIATPFLWGFVLTYNNGVKGMCRKEYIDLHFTKIGDL